MNKAILGEGGTVMQFVGDAVMAVFGAPFPQADHADRAVAAAAGMHALQAEINAAWRAPGCRSSVSASGCPPATAAAALLGSAERLEYTLVGDTVNLAQRLQQFAAAGRDGDLLGHQGRTRPCRCRARAARAAGQGPRHAGAWRSRSAQPDLGARGRYDNRFGHTNGPH